MVRKFLLASATALLLARLASAGTDRVPSPFDASPCASPANVVDRLVNPLGVYGGALKCESLCKSAVNDCRQYVKLAYSCQVTALADDRNYARKNCDEVLDGVEAKACKASVEETIATIRATYTSVRDSSFAGCEGWGQSCRNTCGEAG